MPHAPRAPPSAGFFRSTPTPMYDLSMARSVARALSSLLLCLLLVGWETDDLPLPGRLDPRAIDDDCGTRDRPRRLRAERSTPAPVASGRAIGGLDRDRCARTLREAGVRFEIVPEAEARGVAHPIRIRSALDGIDVLPHDGTNAVLDCRLAVALLAWARDLRAQGVVAIEHVSMYRPGSRIQGTRRTSGHARGLAIDALAFVLADGSRLPVLEAWSDRERGADPCGIRDTEDRATARMRRAVCAAVQRDLFQVVLTPHHDDAHANHVHLEVRPGVDWSFVH
jgi:hypothetical protein